MTNKVTSDQALKAVHPATEMGADLHTIYWMINALNGDPSNLLEYRVKAVHENFQKIAAILGYDIVRAPADQDAGTGPKQDAQPLATQLGLVPPPEAA